MDALDSEVGERFLRHHHFAGRPGFEGKATWQISQRPLFGLIVWKPNYDHGSTVIAPCGNGKFATIAVDSTIQPI